jgi:hypothetical protein
VYCTFEYLEGEEADGQPGLALSLNFNRPTFFAREAFAVVAELCRSLDLRVVDPQVDDHHAVACEPEALERSWTEGNDWAVKAIRAQGGPSLYLDRELAFEWWKYAAEQPALDARFAPEDVFVPLCALVAQHGSDRVRRVIAWTGSIPLVVPLCDLVVLDRRRGRLRRGTDQVVAEADAVLGVIGPALRPLDDDRGTGARLLPREAASDPDLQRAVAALEAEALDPHRFRGIRPEEFVDVPPG